MTNEKKTDCQYYGKGGWCGHLHDEEITITPRGSSKRIICIRCSEIHQRVKECGYYKQKQANDNTR